MPGVLRSGSHGSEVRTLQTQLNARMVPNPYLPVDGIFGTPTRNAVLAFQRRNWLIEDGSVGLCTWNALLGHEAYTPILNTVHFIPQPTSETCWAASAAMLTGTTVQAVVARTPSNLVLADGSLANYSDSDDPITHANRFARANSLSLVGAASSWTVSALVTQLQRGPLMFDLLWHSDEYAQGRGSAGHFIVVVGIRGDNDPSGRGTTLRIYDPWPPGAGRKYSVCYHDWIRDVPTGTYHVFQHA